MATATDQQTNSDYYSGNNSNPGFVTGNNTVPGQQGGMSVGQGGTNVLQQLLQALTTPNSQGGMQGGMSVGAPNNNLQLPPQAQKSAQKALSQYYDAHAQAALQHPDGIAALSAMANGGQASTQGASQSAPQGAPQPQSQGQAQPQGSPQMAMPQQQQANPQAMAVLQQLLQGNPQGAQDLQSGIATPPAPPNILPPTNAFQGSSYNPQTGNIQEGGWANRGLRGLAQGGPMGLLQGLLGPTAQGEMNAVKQAQVLKSGQPAEIAAPLAQARGLSATAKAQELENVGQQPVQKAQVMAAQTAAQEKQIESKKAELQAEQANLQASLKTQTDIMSHPTSMLLGGAQLKDIHDSIQTSMDRISDLQNNIDEASSQYSQRLGIGSPSGQSAQNGGGSIKVGDKFNGETIMHVRRIK